MKRKLLSIKNAKVLSNNNQKSINGGSCPENCLFTGCFSSFIGLPVNGSFCAIASPSGQSCTGHVSNGECCLH